MLEDIVTFTDEDLRIDCAAQVFSPENFTNPITDNEILREKLIEDVADWMCRRQILLHPDTYDERVNRFIEQLEPTELQKFITLFDNNVATVLSSFDSKIALVNKYRVSWKDKFLNGRKASENFLKLLKGLYDDGDSEREDSEGYRGSSEDGPKEQGCEPEDSDSKSLSGGN